MPHDLTLIKIDIDSCDCEVLQGVLEQADYLKLNTGLLLLRVHNWTLALVDRMLHLGTAPAEPCNGPLMRLQSRRHLGSGRRQVRVKG